MLADGELMPCRPRVVWLWSPDAAKNRVTPQAVQSAT